MPSWDSIIAITIAGLVLSASPGPSMFYVLSRTVALGIRGGIASSIGLALGGVSLAFLSALGLSELVKVSPVAFLTLQWMGIVYLAYLGIMMIRDAGKEEVALSSVERSSFSRVLYQGFWVELLNPKTLLFLLVFVPQFIDNTNSDIKLQAIILGVLVPLTAIPADIVVSLAGGGLTSKLAENKRYAVRLERLGGLILIGLSIYIGLTSDRG